MFPECSQLEEHSTDIQRTHLTYVVNERYEIRNPGFHLPVINHKFAEQSLKYCLIRQLNKGQSSNIIADKALRILFYRFKVYLKNRIFGTYKKLCEIANCHVCNIVKNA